MFQSTWRVLGEGRGEKLGCRDYGVGQVYYQALVLSMATGIGNHRCCLPAVVYVKSRD